MLPPSPIVFIYHFPPQFVFIIVKIANQSNRVSRAAKFSHPRSVCGTPCKGPKPVSLPFHMVQLSISACKFDSQTTVQIKLQSTFYFYSDFTPKLSTQYSLAYLQPKYVATYALLQCQIFSPKLDV